jgi:hypothetical protein
MTFHDNYRDARNNDLVPGDRVQFRVNGTVADGVGTVAEIRGPDMKFGKGQIVFIPPTARVAWEDGDEEYIGTPMGESQGMHPAFVFTELVKKEI